MAGKDGYEHQRRVMVDRQIKARGVTDERVLAAMGKVPRHLFVEEALRDQAYRDFPLPIGENQTISQPYMVAEMTRTLEVKKTDRILEIGTGSGYQAAILAELAYKVYTIERHRSLFVQARQLFDDLNYYTIISRCADGTLGWEEEAPFDGIIVTAGAPVVPSTLISQLAVGGRLVIPVGRRDVQSLLKLEKTEDGVRETNLGGCRFVRLVGQKGWDE